MHSVATEQLRVISTDLSWMWTEIGAAIDDGLEFGVAHSDYTAAEVEECLESQASIDLGDKVEQERANRMVRSLGTIQASAIAAAGGAVFNDGKKLKTRLNWILNTGDAINLWVRNGSGVVWTTGSSLSCIGEMWVKDL